MEVGSLHISYNYFFNYYPFNYNIGCKFWLKPDVNAVKSPGMNPGSSYKYFYKLFFYN